jgi:hypothetical protein
MTILKIVKIILKSYNELQGIQFKLLKRYITFIIKVLFTVNLHRKQNGV